MGIKPFSHDIQQQSTQSENIQSERVFMNIEGIIEVDPHIIPGFIGHPEMVPPDIPVLLSHPVQIVDGLTGNDEFFQDFS